MDIKLPESRWRSNAGGGLAEEAGDRQGLDKSPSLQLAKRVWQEGHCGMCWAGILYRRGGKGCFTGRQGAPFSHSGWGLEFQEKKLGSLKIESLRPGSGSVRVSGADFFLGRSFGTDRNSGASVERGVDGALLGPPRVLEGRGVSEMEMVGGKVPIFRLVASCVFRSYSLTSSMVMSVERKV